MIRNIIKMFSYIVFFSFLLGCSHHCSFDHLALFSEYTHVDVFYFVTGALCGLGIYLGNTISEKERANKTLLWLQGVGIVSRALLLGFAFGGFPASAHPDVASVFYDFTFYVWFIGVIIVGALRYKWRSL